MKRFHFDFTQSGYFTLVNQEGEPFFEKVLPIFERVVSHLIWIFLWLSLILACHYFVPLTILYYSDCILMSCIFVHLFLLGCRLTTLLLYGGIKPILFPPLWITLTRKLQNGAGMDLLKKYNLHTHSGLLSNLALIQYSRGDIIAAHNTIQTALIFSPNHPTLIGLAENLLTHIP